MPERKLSHYANTLIAHEISAMTRYYDQIIQLRPLPDDDGTLLNAVACEKKTMEREGTPPTPFLAAPGARTAVLLNGNINYEYDIQALIEGVKPRLSRNDRLVFVAYNSYLGGVYRALNWLGLRKAPLPTTFVTNADFKNLARLAGFEIVRSRQVAYFPFRCLGLGCVLNSVLAVVPFVRWAALASVITLRPLTRTADSRPSLSILVPVRNERGNLAAIFDRLPDFGAQVEIIFVEGHSDDGSWEEIQRLTAQHSAKYLIKSIRQSGNGKGDAVRLGFSQATCDLLTILDADLTMPPELLIRFYEAYRLGLADFINGTRLVYPMEGEAMRFLNRLGNVFFAKALSMVLETSLGDSLCGTKLLTRSDYARVLAWRKNFGEFDPFGDFELLFPAAILGFGIVDIPIRYRARTYGSTKISRFRHGLMLLKMVIVGALGVRTGRVK